MLKLEDIMRGKIKIRSVKDREGDMDYFIDNFGKPMILDFKVEMQFFQVSTILVRIGQGSLYSVHFLMDRDLFSSMAFIELDAKEHYIDYSMDDEKSYLHIGSEKH